MNNNVRPVQSDLRRERKTLKELVKGEREVVRDEERHTGDLEKKAREKERGREKG